MAEDDKGPEKPFEPYKMVVGRGEYSLEMTVTPEAELAASGSPIVGMRMPLEEELKNYAPGSVALPCSLCQCDVLVSPSSQILAARGNNPLVCMECWTQAQSAES
jgi:hypothetical protein